LAAGISAAVFLINDRVRDFGRYGYPGIFVLSLLASATIVVPAPSLAVVSIMGSVLNPFAVGLCAGAGEALGELTGYLAGYSGRAVIEDQKRYEQLVGWTQRYGLWVILVLSIIPNPLFDLAGIAAGALKIPVRRFLVTCWIGKTIKTVLFAFGGHRIAELLPFLRR
jgi:membrane protein YqaA with SNARE-associated domain